MPSSFTRHKCFSTHKYFKTKAKTNLSHLIDHSRLSTINRAFRSEFPNEFILWFMINKVLPEFCCRHFQTFVNRPFLSLQKVVKAMGKTWHEDHFVCGGPCKKPMSGTPFFEREGKPYCKADFEKLFAAKCEGCKNPITENTVIALNAKWHKDCFKCKVTVFWHCRLLTFS